MMVILPAKTENTKARINFWVRSREEVPFGPITSDPERCQGACTAKGHVTFQCGDPGRIWAEDRVIAMSTVVETWWMESPREINAQDWVGPSDVFLKPSGQSLVKEPEEREGEEAQYERDTRACAMEVRRPRLQEVGSCLGMLRGLLASVKSCSRSAPTQALGFCKKGATGFLPGSCQFKVLWTGTTPNPSC